MGMERYGNKGPKKNRPRGDDCGLGVWGDASRRLSPELTPNLKEASKNRARLKQDADKKASERVTKKRISLGGDFGKDKK